MIRSTVKATVLSFLILSLPLFKTTEADVRTIDSELVVSVSSNNPAMAAYMDSQLEIEESKIFNVAQAIQLQTGYSEKIDNINEPIKIVAPTSFNSIKEEEVVVTLDKNFPNMHDTQGNLLSLSERKKILQEFLANNDRYNLPAETWQEKAKDLIQATENKSRVEQNEKIIMAASSFNPILIKKPDLKNSSINTTKPTAAINTASKNSVEPTKKPEVTSVKSFSSPEQTNSYVISGEIELAGGLAFMGQNSNLQVYRELDGEIINIGKVWLSQGRYEIVIDELTGYLIIELTDNQGETLGMAEQDLYAWEQLPYATNKIQGVHFLLEPLEKGINLEVISSRSYKDKNIYIDNAQVSIDDLGRRLAMTSKHKYHDKFFYQDSLLWVRIQKEKYWDTLSQLPAYGSNQLQLFPEAYLQAIAVDLKTELNDKKGWIAGQVKGRSGPLKNVAIEVAGLNKNFKGIYFNTTSELVHWPDQKLEQTSNNGLFIVPNLEPGIYAVRMRIGKEFFPAEVIKVEAKEVTYLDLSYVDMRTASINIFDRVYGVNHLSAQLRVYGAEQELFVSGSINDVIRFPSGQGSMTFEVDAGSEYMLAKSKLPRNLRSIRIPLVSQKWFQQTLETQGIVYDKNLGSAVGFIDGDNFDVMLSNHLEEQQIIYFNQKGEVVDSGVRGGGFIIVNLPEGLTSIAVIPQNKKSILMKSLTFEAGYVNSFESNL